MRVLTILVLSCIVLEGTHGHCIIERIWNVIKAIWELYCAATGHTHGDPHFITFDDHRFSYHGECDLVLVNTELMATGVGLRVHMRTKILRSYSFVQAPAIQIGKEVFEIKLQKFFLNGKVIHDIPENFAGYKVERLTSLEWCEERNCTDTMMMRVDLDKDGSIQVAGYKGFLYVQVSARGEGFLNATGILGATGRDGQFGRDGRRFFDDTLFAEEWQVLDTEPRLFVDNRFPQHPMKCIPPPESTIRRIIDEGGDLYKIAVNACSFAEDADKDFCIFDVLATRDLDMAMPYRAGTF